MLNSNIFKLLNDLSNLLERYIESCNFERCSNEDQLNVLAYICLFLNSKGMKNKWEKTLVLKFNKCNLCLYTIVTQSND